MSDGTNIITFLNPQTFTITKTIDVNEYNVAIDYVNELEYVNGFIYANIYMKNEILKINAETGDVVGRIDLNPLLQEAQKRYPYSLETNGIAYNSQTNTFLVTGKMWPYYFEIELLN
jgi:glutamine cyclotransferase